MEVLGYCFDPLSIKKHVSGYSHLSPKSRHALRDIFDLIWESDTMSVIDDATLISYMGLTKREWVAVKKEIFGLSPSFVSLSSGYWSSKWLEKQRKSSPDIMKNNPRFSKSFAEIKENAEITEENDENDDFLVEVFDDFGDNVQNAKQYLPTGDKKRRQLFSQESRKKSVREKSEDIGEALENRLRGKYYDQE